ncbi:MAG: hypothetical protein M3024_04610 [Candidatus Dormibacteraeota bacterium]|nr:hypothetical protein [Candidatus Dormibacteraeota bacterium]
MTTDATPNESTPESEGAASELQEAVRSVAEAHRGEEADFVFTALKAELAKRLISGDVSNELLHSYASAIAEGKDVTVRPEDIG